MDWNRLEQLVEEAMELPVEQRSEFLNEACGEDAELRAEAMSLVWHVDPSDDFFSALARKVEESQESQRPSADPDRIGPFKLLELLGEGGMGRVWLAEQEEPVKRRVALKVIKLGMDTKEVVARFESERQALAVMDHPGIARVFDGGVTDEGRPYFVMEVVKGVPITEYCDTYRLDTASRLRLFIDVCRAVQHAHVKGVIHRDLKPSNVLITVKDSGPAVKVIDFGVAKAITGSLTHRTFVTSMGQTVGTPAYMSPEQAGPNGLDVDSRTDVYALGIMLYELLIGALPFSVAQLGQAHAFLRFLLSDEDVPTPSARLSDLAATQETVARSRRTDVRTLRRELKGDLDWIVMKAIEKDRTRRYETVNGLADDLGRVLRHEPVVARPPTPMYRLQRFVRRNRAGVAAAAITAGTLVAGILGTSAGLVRARAAEAEALSARATIQEKAVREQKLLQYYASGVLELQTSVSYLADDNIPPPPVLMPTLRFLDFRTRRYLLQDEPLLAAHAWLMTGSLYSFMDAPDQALRLLEDAWAVTERELGQGRADGESARPESSRSYGSESSTEEGPDEGFERSLATFELLNGPGSVEVAYARHILGAYYLREKWFDVAVRHYLEAIRIFRTFEDQPLSGYVTVAFKLRYDAIEQLGKYGRWEEVAVVLGHAVAEYDRRTQPSRDRARELAWVLARYQSALVELGRADDARAAAELAAEVANALESTPLRLQFAIPRSLIPSSMR